MSTVRHRRLRRISRAQQQIEHSLLKLRKEGNPTLEDDLAFRELYYLVRLSKKSPMTTLTNPSLDAHGVTCNFTEDKQP